MKKGPAILVLGILASIAAFAAVYYLGTLHCRDMMRGAKPELVWLKHEFKLTDAELSRITQLHEAYLPLCHERCKRIAEQDEKLQQLLAHSAFVTPEIQALLSERAKTRADCEAEMLKHFLEVSRTMPPEQGQRYLAWVQKQSSLHGAGMEQSHGTDHEHHM
jgi:Spy/CpxP family protein refolding chaperone